MYGDIFWKRAKLRHFHQWECDLTRSIEGLDGSRNTNKGPGYDNRMHVNAKYRISKFCVASISSQPPASTANNTSSSQRPASRRLQRESQRIIYYSLIPITLPTSFLVAVVEELKSLSKSLNFFVLATHFSLLDQLSMRTDRS